MDEMTEEERDLRYFRKSLRESMEACHKEVLASPQWERIIFFRNAMVQFRQGIGHEPKPENYGLKYEGTCEHCRKLVDL